MTSPLTRIQPPRLSYWFESSNFWLKYSKCKTTQSCLGLSYSVLNRPHLVHVEKRHKLLEWKGSQQNIWSSVEGIEWMEWKSMEMNGIKKGENKKNFLEGFRRYFLLQCTNCYNFFDSPPGIVRVNRQIQIVRLFFERQKRRNKFNPPLLLNKPTVT